MALTANPFIVLSYVGGPALLTNASSLFVLSTANRFARAIDRSRFLADRLAGAGGAEVRPSCARELVDVGRRVRLIARAISAFYLAAATFALATLSSIAGAVLTEVVGGLVGAVIVAAAVLSGIVGFAAFVTGAISLVIESRLAVRSLAREAAQAENLVRTARS